MLGWWARLQITMKEIRAGPLVTQSLKAFDDGGLDDPLFLWFIHKCDKGFVSPDDILTDRDFGLAHANISTNDRY